MPKMQIKKSANAKNANLKISKKSKNTSISISYDYTTQNVFSGLKHSFYGLFVALQLAV